MVLGTAVAPPRSVLGVRDCDSVGFPGDLTVGQVPDPVTSRSKERPGDAQGQGQGQGQGRLVNGRTVPTKVRGHFLTTMRVDGVTGVVTSVV